MDLLFIKAQMLMGLDMLMANMLIDFLITAFIAALAFNAGRKYERSKQKEESKEEDWEPREPTL